MGSTSEGALQDGGRAVEGGPGGGQVGNVKGSWDLTDVLDLYPISWECRAAFLLPVVAWQQAQMSTGYSGCLPACLLQNNCTVRLQSEPNLPGRKYY